MNTQRAFVRPTLLRTLSTCIGALALAAAALPAGAASMPDSVAIDAQCQPRLSHREAVVYEKAGQGTDALRRYLSMRQFMLLDTTETAAWADGVDRLRAACLVASARAKGDAVAASAGADVVADVVAGK